MIAFRKQQIIGMWFFLSIFDSDRDAALSYAESRGLAYNSDGTVFKKDGSDYTNVCYPRVLEESVKGYISHVRIDSISNTILWN